jgi:hypothetical protein
MIKHNINKILSEIGGQVNEMRHSAPNSSVRYFQNRHGNTFIDKVYKACYHIFNKYTKRNDRDQYVSQRFKRAAGWCEAAANRNRTRPRAAWLNRVLPKVGKDVTSRVRRTGYRRHAARIRRVCACLLWRRKQEWYRGSNGLSSLSKETKGFFDITVSVKRRQKNESRKIPSVSGL